MNATLSRLIAFIFTCFSLTCLAQHSEDLSAEQAYQLYQENPSAKTFHEYAYQTWFVNVDTAIYLMYHLFDLAKAERDWNTHASAHIDIARMYMEKTKFDSSEYHFERAIEISNEFGFHQIEGYAYSNRSYMRFNYTADVKGSVEDVHASMDIFESIEDYIGLSFGYQNLGGFYYHFGQFETAAKLYSEIPRVRTLSTEPPSFYNEIEAEWNLAYALLRIDGRKKEAIDILSRSIERVQKPTEEYQGAIWIRLLIYRALAYIRSDEFEKAQMDLDIAQRDIISTDFHNIWPLFYFTNGFLAYEQKDFDGALNFLKRVGGMHFSSLADPLLKLDALVMMEDIHNHFQDLDKAYAARREHSKLYDTLFNPNHLALLLSQVRDDEEHIKEQQKTIEKSESLATQLGEINTQNKLSILALIISLILGVYYGLKYRMNEKLRRAALRTNISKNLHDEVGGILAGIALKSDIAQMKSNNEGEEIEGIAQMSRKALGKMSDVLWSIDARRDSTEELIFKIREYTAEMCGLAEIAYSFNIDTIKNKRVSSDKRQHIYLIFKEAVNNVVKHSKASELNIVIKNDNHFEMIIEDNGIGRENAQKSSGQGLSNLKSRAKDLKGEIDITFENGCKVHLICPKI